MKPLLILGGALAFALAMENWSVRRKARRMEKRDRKDYNRG